MRTKRSTETKKPKARAAKKPATQPSDKKTWVASIDGLSLGIAGAAVVAAGILVAAYKPAHSADAATQATISMPSGSTAAADVHTVSAANRSGAEATSTASQEWPVPMTITGCLDRDGDEYRLTNAAGMGVPKTRSWKSGFLKKTNASSITIVDGNRHSRLQDHLGQKVSVTGTIVNREIQLGTLRSLSESCSDKTKI